MTPMAARRRSGAAARARLQTEEHGPFMKRISRSLYYGRLPRIPSISMPAMELSTELFSESQKGRSLKRLYLEDASKLARNACVSPCSLVLALVYLERLKTCNPEYVANMAPNDLFLISLMVSNKFQEDDGEEYCVYSDEWATSAGITLPELNSLERNFLSAIDWKVFVSKDQFDSTLEWLECQIAQRQGRQRGWFTYADLASIPCGENSGLIKCLATVYAALSISYLASVSAIVASTIITSHSMTALSLTSSTIADTFNYYVNPPINYTEPDYAERFDADGLISNDFNSTGHSVLNKLTAFDGMLRFIDAHRKRVEKMLRFGRDVKRGFDLYDNRSSCCDAPSALRVHFLSLPVAC